MTKRRWKLFAVILAIGGGLYLLPPYTLDPTCTYDVNYRVTATITVDSIPYTSSVVRQNSRSRKWAAVINSAGCPQYYGTALVFRLRDDRAILMPSRICVNAEQEFLRATQTPINDYDFNAAMWQRQVVDVTRFCSAIGRNKDTRYPTQQPDGFIIDNADHPTKWKTFAVDPKIESVPTIRIISASAEAMYASPTDNIDQLAPGLLRATFRYRGQWWESPEPLIAFNRRTPTLKVQADDPLSK